jgi:hypothetical protein
LTAGLRLDLGDQGLALAIGADAPATLTHGRSYLDRPYTGPPALAGG